MIMRMVEVISNIIIVLKILFLLLECSIWRY